MPAPSFGDHDELVSRFNSLMEDAFTGVMGAIDGTHISILTPCLNPNDYFCYKKFKSVVLLAIASPISECLWFNVGYPGKASDSRIYCETGVKEFVETLKHDEHLIGDSAFPLSRGLMKPYQ